MKNTLKRRYSIYMTALILMIAVVIGVAVIWVAPIRAYAIKSDFETGTGTKDDPFHVSTVKEFNAIATRPDAYFVQTEDIDFTGEIFYPIGDLTHPFTGHYNGSYNGKQSVLTGINADFPNRNDVGVFSFIYGGGVIENIRIEDSTFVGHQNVGAVAGINAGRIVGAVVDAKVTANGNAAGGVAGSNSGIISLSVNSGEITAANMYAGGIVGTSTGNITDSYNRGAVYANTYAGGIVGVNNGKASTAVIGRAFNVGELNSAVKGQIAGDNLGAVIKQARYMDSTDPDCVSAFNTGSVYASVSRPSFEFKSKIAFADWVDFDENFMFVNGGKHPILKIEYIKVTEVKFEAGSSIRLRPGDELAVGAYVLPKRANTRSVALSTDADSASCTLSDGVVKISDTAEVGSYINILGEADGVSGLLRIEIVKIPVEQIELATDNGKVAVVPGGTLQFYTAIFPANATIKDVKYSSTNPHFADIDVNGRLSVALDAPIGLKFTVSAASYDNIGIRSGMEITVVAAEVKSVKVTNNVTTFSVSESLALEGHAVTESIETNEVIFEIDGKRTTASGAKIVNGILYAELPGDIYVIPQYAGVSGEAKLFTVIEEPVVSVEIINNNSFSINGALSIIAKALPDNATYPEITLSIVGENKIGAVLNGNVLTASKTGTVIIRAEAGGVCATKTIYAEPASEHVVEIVDIILERSEFSITRSLTLVPQVLPSEAVAAVYFDIIDDGGTGAVLENGVLKNADAPGIISLKAYTARFEKVLNVEVLKIGVDSVQFTNTNRFKITNGLPLSVATIPVNPTFSEVTYKIIDSEDTEAIIKDGVLYASNVGEIKVVATVDGVASDPFTVYADKEPVTEVYLTSTDRSFKCTESLMLEAIALPVQATYKDIEFIIDKSSTTHGINAQINNNVLTADAPGIVTVVMRCDGHDYIEVISVEKEPVTGIELQYKVESDNPNETEFRTSGYLDLSAVVYPFDATYKGVIIKIIDSGKTGAVLVDSKNKNDNPQRSKTAFSGETDKIYLCANKPGEIHIRVTSIDNPSIFKDYYGDDCIKVLEEPVAEIYFAMDVGAEDTAFKSGGETISRGDAVGEYNGVKYYYYKEAYIKAKSGESTFSLPFAIITKASDENVCPTYENDFKLCYYTSYSDYVTDTGRTELTDVNPYFVVEMKTDTFGSLIAKSQMGVIWVVAVSDGGEKEVISPAVKITIYPTNVDDLKDLGVDKDGVVKLMTSTSPKIEAMDGYEVTVKTNKFEYTTFVATQSTELQLKLYKYSLNITEIAVNVVFARGSTLEYKFNVPMNIATVKNESGVEIIERSNDMFTGIKALPKAQLMSIAPIGKNDYSAVVLYDFYRTSYNFDRSLTYDSGVRSMYVYGYSGATHSGLDFTFNNGGKEVEITLNNAKFKARNNHDAIRINGKGILTLKLIGNSELYGGDGDNGKAGANGYSRKKTDTANRSGYSLNGADYGDVQWNPFGDNPDGNPGKPGGDGNDGKNGARGQDGRNGGFAIRLQGCETDFISDCSNISVPTVDPNATLRLYGGNGGDGGRGGNGDNGQGGQNGGRGGDGGTKYCVVFDLGGSGGNGGDGGDGGRGGNAGNGGNAGRGGLGANSSALLSKPGVKPFKGTDGKKGEAGDVGRGGKKGLGGAGGNGGQGFYIAVVVPITYTGSKGANGKDGIDGKDGNAGTWGSMKEYSNEIDNMGII